MNLIVGAIVAACIALVALRARSLSPSGALAAVLLGTVAAAAGYDWAVLLILYFASSTTLSRLGRTEKERRTASVVEKGGERDAVQVFANGAIFGLAALEMYLHADVRWIALGAGSLAASAADTWATEIGTLYGGQPRSILNWRHLAPGTSGGVSLAGTVASVAGTLFIALLAFAGNRTSIGDVSIVWPVFIGGFVGALADSLLGATIQSRRWCGTCRRETERTVHDCGAATTPQRGLVWINNDVVNFVSTIIGGLLAARLVR